MNRVNQILQHKDYKLHLDHIVVLEENRIFCKHGLEHLLDTARIAYIMVLEAALSIPKDIIYGCALLHDIGKYYKYEEGIAHETAGALIALPILRDCGYKADEIDFMLDAIKEHRILCTSDKKDFKYILYQADKKSRLCITCSAKDGCNWPDSKKNRSILY